jgi:Uma2 family endonuclease
MSPTRVVQPDLIVVRPTNRDILKDHIYGVPDLLVEILSSSNRKHDTVRKRRLYARNRVPEYWIVDPEEQTVEFLELVEGGLSYRQHGWFGPGDVVRSATFELALPIDELFAT